MNYGSVCSGIEAASLAWRGLGWKPLFVSEVEPLPAAVLCERLNATRPLRPLAPETAPTPKDRKLRESWAKAVKTLPETGTLPNLGDFTHIKETDYDGKLDLLGGGTPCQSFSLAGMRRGLADPRVPALLQPRAATLRPGRADDPAVAADPRWRSPGVPPPRRAP